MHIYVSMHACLNVWWYKVVDVSIPLEGVSNMIMEMSNEDLVTPL